MDNLIIEHLACLEINRLILQEPYRLVSEVQFNDKSPSFDGEIIVYNSSDLKKANIEDYVKVQIKGTTKHKKVKGNKTPYSLGKEDLEVYKKTGKGVLYLLVVIEKKNKNMQAFYKALTPLEIERILGEISYKDQNSYTVDFKKINDNQLEQICLTQIRKVRKQPSYFIEVGKSKHFSSFRLEYDVLPSEIPFFNPLETPIDIYGIEDGNEYPIEAVVPDSLTIENLQKFNFGKEIIEISTSITENMQNINILVEDTLTINFSKVTKKGKLKFERLKTLSSYIKSLKTLHYILVENKFPFKAYNIIGSIDDKTKFDNINHEIERYENLLKVCERIGIRGDYVFESTENIDTLFNDIIDVFEHRNYANFESLNLENHTILQIHISENISLLLWKNHEDNLYYNLFDINIFEKIGAFIPKNEGVLDPNVDDHYKVSIFVVYPFNTLIELANFNFDIYRQSIVAGNHDKTLELNNNLALDLISGYLLTQNLQYLDLAKYLLEELKSTDEENTIYRLNILLTRKLEGSLYQEEQEEFLYSVVDGEELSLKFGANVLLGAKIPAKKNFEQLSIEEQNKIKEYPIYFLYTDL